MAQIYPHMHMYWKICNIIMKKYNNTVGANTQKWFILLHFDGLTKYSSQDKLNISHSYPCSLLGNVFTLAIKYY